MRRAASSSRTSATTPSTRSPSTLSRCFSRSVEASSPTTRGRAGAWQSASQFCYFDHPIHDLAGSTLGIIGEGAIGQAVAELGRAFGMSILYAAHKNVSGLGPLYTPFEEVLETSDVITLHCPLMPSTRNLIGPPSSRA